MLVAYCSLPKQWARYEAGLHDGSMTLRDVLSAQAALIGVTVDEADAVLARKTHFDPTFAAFVERSEREGVPLTILSSGVSGLIERALARNNLSRVPFLANAATPSERGWIMHYRDESANGHDKAAAVRAAKAPDATVAFIGDGYSDFEAAVAADRRFAKRGRSLERYLRSNGVPFTPFDSFAEILPAIF